MKSTDIILLVEDQDPWRKSFARIVKDYGESREVVYVDKEDFNDRFRVASDFDKVAYCLIDLELNAHSSRRVNDTTGFDEVLPKVRVLAPWVPTGCVSVHLFQDHEILRRVSLGDFDGLFPKQSILADTPKEHMSDTRVAAEFNAYEWKKILRSLSVKRVAAMTGISVSEANLRLQGVGDLARRVKLSPAMKIAAQTDGEITNFAEALALLGFRADDIRINEITPGFSGINVGRLQLLGRDELGNYDACWLLKWGRPVRKLHQEIRAHYQMLRRGLDRILLVPPVYNEVVAWNNVGYIAYRFEAETQTAAEYTRKCGSNAFRTMLGKITTKLYKENRKGFAKPSDVLAKWCRLDESRTASLFGEKALHPLEVSECLIHGDLHLRNILIRDEEPTLIDFARSDVGPIVVDLAKLIVDTFQLLPPSAISSAIFDFANCEGTEVAGIIDCFKQFLSATDDAALYSFLSRGFAYKYLEYPDVSEDTKSAITRALQ